MFKMHRYNFIQYKVNSVTIPAFIFCIMEISIDKIFLMSKEEKLI